MWQLSIRSKIILTLLLTGLSCLATGAIIGYRAGETALTRSVEEQLTAQREIKRRRIESYVDNELRFTVAIGGLPETTEAAKALIAAYREMHAVTQADPAATQADTLALENWYNKDLLPRLDKVAGSHTPLEGLMPTDLVRLSRPGTGNCGWSRERGQKTHAFLIGLRYHIGRSPGFDTLYPRTGNLVPFSRP
jgi:hypothetical protein